MRSSPIIGLLVTVGDQVFSRSLRTGDLLFLMMGSLFFLAGLSTCWAADVVLIRGKHPYPIEQEEIRRLVEFYGLKLHTVDVGSQDAVDRAILRLRSPDTLAVLTSPDALIGLNRKQIQAALQRPKGLGIPMLVVCNPSPPKSE